MVKKRLIYRLSSLGDIAIAMAILERPFVGETHWVIAQEFAPLLIGKAGVTRVIAFDRRNQKFGDWIRLNRGLAMEGFGEVIDLHRTARTAVARWVFLITALFHSEVRLPRWHRISKERMKRLGYILAKRAWPQRWRPRGVRAQILGTSAGLCSRQNFRSRPKIGIAASSAWKGKEWPVEKFHQLLMMMQSDFDFVILGTPTDRASVLLLEQLRASGLQAESWLGKYPLGSLVEELSALDLVISCDSGLAHLAELASLPVVAIYGPTRLDFGFGLKGERSRAVETDLWCSPCSKDGSLCFRVTERFKCLHVVSVGDVEKAVREVLRAGESFEK